MGGVFSDMTKAGAEAAGSGAGKEIARVMICYGARYVLRFAYCARFAYRNYFLNCLVLALHSSTGVAC